MKIKKRRLLIPALLTIFLLALVSYFLAVRPWMLSWGASSVESAMPLPGDELVPRFDYQNTRALTINAPVEDIWPWLVQVGQDRGGFYSYSWLENMVFADIHNADHTDPAWQDLKSGDFVPLVTKNWPLGFVKRKEPVIGCPVYTVEQNNVLVLRGWGSFILRPVTAETTRLVARSRYGPFPSLLRPLWQAFFDSEHFVMERQMMKGIKSRAEGEPQTPGAWQSFASAGFILAALGSILYVISGRKKRPWLAIPFVYALLIIFSTFDFQAALVGFTALCLVVAGCLFFRRWWWAYLGLMFIYAHFVLFLPWDAYLVFGLVFLVVFALGSVILLAKREFIRKIS
ncbi:MAG: hypothetical protein AB1715_00385 [Acidobacteriota bacterium]